MKHCVTMFAHICTTPRPRRRKVDNWGGGGQIFIYSYIHVLHHLFPLKAIVFTVCEHEYMTICPPPQLSTFRRPCASICNITLLYASVDYFGGRTFCRKTLCRKTFCRKTFCRTDILPTDVLPNGHFAERTFCRTDSLTNVQLVENRDIF